MTDKHASSDSTAKADRHDKTSIPIDVTDRHEINAENTLKGVDDETGTLQENAHESVQEVANEGAIDRKRPGEAIASDATISGAKANEDTAVVDIVDVLETTAVSPQTATDEKTDVDNALKASSTSKRLDEGDGTFYNSQPESNDEQMSSTIVDIAGRHDGDNDDNGDNGDNGDTEARGQSEKSQPVHEQTRIVGIENEINPEVPPDTARTINEETIIGDVANLPEMRIVGDDHILLESQGPEEVACEDDVRTAQIVDNDGDEDSTEDTAKDTVRTDNMYNKTTDITENLDNANTSLPTDKNDNGKQETEIDTKL